MDRLKSERQRAIDYDDYHEERWNGKGSENDAPN